MLDKKTFERIFDLYYTPLCKYLYLYTNDFDLIEDTVQSVFVKIWEDKERISDSNIKTYLYIAARTRLFNSIRNIKTRDTLLENFYKNELVNTKAEEIIDIDEFLEIIQESINKLPPKVKEIYKLSREEKLTYKEIASKQKISIKTVENQISNALKRISEHLKEHYNKSFGLIFCIINSFLS